MIVFIAMVLVAGIAASVLITTSNNLETQALATGHETKDEVSSRIEVIDVTGNYNTRTIDGTPREGYHNMTITVVSKSGSEIGLDEVIIRISNESRSFSLSWDTTYSYSSSGNGIFSTSGAFDLDAKSFGIIEILDADNSSTASNPAINLGDKMALTVNLSANFGWLGHGSTVRGMVIAEEGSPGVFLFRTPNSNSRTVVNLL
jgi:flagellin FlaB